LFDELKATSTLSF